MKGNLISNMEGDIPLANKHFHKKVMHGRMLNYSTYCQCPSDKRKPSHSFAQPLTQLTFCV